MTPRARFSPAPSGELHVGSARTALFNWLFARHSGGAFLLRIEDTDPSRTREEWVTGVQDALRWLGLDWDEPPVRQSTRRAAYLAAAVRLLEQGDAYESFETPDELAAINEERRARGLPPGYDGRGRDLDPAAREALRAAGRPVTVRFRTPDTGTSTFHDLVRGVVTVDWSTVPDFVIVRSDGTPLFFLANAVDDIETGITHVIRGEDLLDSTHRVLAIRAALGRPDPPVYAHLPLILSPDRAKLSKRHGAVAVEDLRAHGVLPEALLNYLALLGWSPEDGREVMTREELVEAFELERVNRSPAVFDARKLEWIGGEWMRRLPLDELVRRVRPLVEARVGPVADEVLRDAVRIGQERAATLGTLVEQMEFLFASEDTLVIDPRSWEQLAATDRAEEVLEAVGELLDRCPWSAEGIEGAIRDGLASLGLDARRNKREMRVLYTAIEGRAAGLPLFDSVRLLGRDRARARLQAVRARLAG